MILTTLIILLSITYVMVLPVNFLLWDIPYGVYNLIAVLTIVFFWIAPLYYLRVRNKVNYLNVAILVILNILMASYVIYNGEKYWKQLEYRNIQKAQQYGN